MNEIRKIEPGFRENIMQDGFISHAFELIERYENRAFCQIHFAGSIIGYDIAKITVYKDAEHLTPSPDQCCYRKSDVDGKAVSAFSKRESEALWKTTCKNIADAKVFQEKQIEDQKLKDQEKALKLSIRTGKIAEAQKTKYEIRGKLKKVLTEARDFKSIAVNKKVQQFANEINLCDLIISNI